MTVSLIRQNHFAWLVVCLLFLGSVVNYMDRAVLGVVMPQVRRDLSLSNADYGFVVNTFLTFYMVLYVLGGRVADRLGCRRTFSLTLAFWSVAAISHSLVRGMGSLCFFRGMLGIGEGAYYPAAIRGATDWFSSKNRAKAVGLLLSGLSLGTLLTPPIVAWITIRYSWRVAFLLTGFSGLLLLPPWLIVHRKIQKGYGVADPWFTIPTTPARPGEEEDVPLSAILKTRQYLYLLISRAASDATWYFYLFWIPAYFQEIRGFDTTMVGKLLWIPFFASAVGAVAGAWASSALIQRGMTVDCARKSVLILSALSCLAGASAFLTGPFQALALVTLALFGYQSWSSNLHTAITEISPRKHASVLYGITGASGALAGAITQPLIGHIIDFRGYNPVFVLVGFLHFTAVVFLLSAGKIEPIGRQLVAREVTT
ncbi:MAG TPA: MFS transporter [Terriglobia bacterium]|nr:MFS transporter [Terriglobia bacterium]